MTADAPANEVSGRQREPEAVARRPHTATLSVSYPSPESAALVEASLRPEVDRIDDDRATASVRRAADEVEITVHATDLVALRAGTASWSRLLEVAERVAGVAA